MSLSVPVVPTTAPTDASLRTLQPRLAALFAVNGLLYASWAVEIPNVQARLHLQPVSLALLLFTVMAGNLIALPPVRRLLVERGSRAALLLSLLLLCAPLALLGTSASLPVAFLAALLYGIGFGGMDFTLNAVGGWLQEQRERPIMSGLHAAYSLGTLCGSLLGAALLARQVQPDLHLGSLAVAGVLVGTACLRGLPGRIEQPPAERPGHPPVTLLLLLIPGFFAAYAEGSVTDWSALYLSGVFGTPHARATLGLVLFSGLMLLGRVVGDAVTRRIGPQRLVLAATGASTAGLLLISLSQTLPGSVAGFGLVGAGVSVLAPLTFSAAWRVNGSAGVALLTAVFYGGYLAAPPLTGLVVQHFQIGQTFAVPLLLALASLAVVIGRPLYREAQDVPQTN